MLDSLSLPQQLDRNSAKSDEVDLTIFRMKSSQVNTHGSQQEDFQSSGGQMLSDLWMRAPEILNPSCT